MKNRRRRQLDGNVSDFVEDYHLRSKCRLTSKIRPGWGEGAKTYACKVMAGALTSAVKRKPISVQFTKGRAHTDAPTTNEVVAALIEDARTSESVSSAKHLAQDFGYDYSTAKDRLRVHSIYRAINRNANKLRELLGTAFYKEALKTDPE